MGRRELGLKAEEERIQGERLRAHDGKVQRYLSRKLVPASIACEVRANAYGINAFRFLSRDLRAYVWALRALTDAQTDEPSIKYLVSLNRCRPNNRCRRLACPICRHLHRTAMVESAAACFGRKAAKMKYAFLTIIHAAIPCDDPELDDLISKELARARRTFQKIRKRRAITKRGFICRGQFELDFSTSEQLEQQPIKRQTIDSLAKRASDAYVVVTSHVVVQVNSINHFKRILDDYFPMLFQKRVEEIKNDEDLWCNLRCALEYSVKGGDFFRGVSVTRSGESNRTTSNYPRRDLAHANVARTVIRNRWSYTTVREYLHLLQRFGFSRLSISYGHPTGRQELRRVKPNKVTSQISAQKRKSLATAARLRAKVSVLRHGIAKLRLLKTARQLRKDLPTSSCAYWPSPISARDGPRNVSSATAPPFR